MTVSDSGSAGAFELDGRQHDLRSTARELSDSLAPFAQEADEMLEIHEGMRSALHASGLTRIVVPKAYGGVDDTLDPLSIAVVRESLMYNSAHLDCLFGMQGVGSYALTSGGTEELKQLWLPRVAELEAIAGLALTEPDVGSDLRAVTTTIVERDGQLIINGRKSFITNAPVADFFCVLAKEGDGYSMAFVPTVTAGLTTTSGPDIIAPHVIGDVTFDDVAVPVSHRLGEPGQAFSLMLRTLAVFRVTVAGAALGLAHAAIDEGMAHVTERTQFGRPLLELGAVGQQMASSWADLEAARALTYRAASRARRDPLASLDQSSLAKVFATEAAGRIVDRSVQVMGRFGLVRGSKIERLYRNARPLRVYEGATEVLLDALARRLGKLGGVPE